MRLHDAGVIAQHNLIPSLETSTEKSRTWSASGAPGLMWIQHTGSPLQVGVGSDLPY